VIFAQYERIPPINQHVKKKLYTNGITIKQIKIITNTLRSKERQPTKFLPQHQQSSSYNLFIVPGASYLALDDEKMTTIQPVMTKIWSTKEVN